MNIAFEKFQAVIHLIKGFPTEFHQKSLFVSDYQEFFQEISFGLQNLKPAY